GRHSLGTVFGFSSEDEAIKRIFELEEELRRTRFATGGLVPGAGNRDSVRASLMPGEYVVRKSVVEQLGVGFFDRLNKGFASGGLVQQQTSAPSIGGFPEFRGSANMF